MAEVMEVKNLEFKWGKKSGLGGQRQVQLYESFTYDGQEYTLYDNVYLHKEGESFPYIGKLVKIWENPDKSKEVKVLWYFHHIEISNYVSVELTHPNEVFLACGEGVGLTDNNSLEAIGGKCNLVCISKDSRNPQPSVEQLQMADFVFYRFFDVGQCIVVDKIDEKIAGVDVKFIFNQVGYEKPCSVSRLGVDERVSLPKPDSSDNQILEDDKLEKQKTVVGEKLDGNGRQEKAAICETASRLQVQEDSVEPIFSHQEKVVSGVGTESDRSNKTNCRQGNNSGEKISLSPKVKVNADLKVWLVNKKKTLNENIAGVGGSSVNRAKVDEKLKSTKNGEIDERPHKKAKLDSSVKVSNDKNRNIINKSNRISSGNNSKPLVDKIKKPFIGKLPKESPKLLPRDVIKSADKGSAFTSRPNSDRSKWFAELPWEEGMQEAHECGKLVLFQNLDPAYTSAEVEGIVCEVFKEKCKAKMVQKTAYSSPHSGQAFAIFKTSKVAEHVVAELDEGCLLLPNGRLLVASIANPCFPGKRSTFAGHLILNKLKSNREMKEAVSTSHSSQPNTLEYDMAVDWCLLVEILDQFWKSLYERHGEELEKLKANFKSK